MARPVPVEYTDGADVCPKLNAFSTPVCPLNRNTRTPNDAIPSIFCRKARATSSLTSPIGTPGNHWRYIKMSRAMSACTGMEKFPYSSLMVAVLMLPPSYSYDKFAINRPFPVAFPVAEHFFGMRSSGNPSISARSMCLAHDGPNKMVLLCATSVHTVRQISCLCVFSDAVAGGQCERVRLLR